MKAGGHNHAGRTSTRFVGRSESPPLTSMVTTSLDHGDGPNLSRQLSGMPADSISCGCEQPLLLWEPYWQVPGGGLGGHAVHAGPAAVRIRSSCLHALLRNQVTRWHLNQCLRAGVNNTGEPLGEAAPIPAELCLEAPCRILKSSCTYTCLRQIDNPTHGACILKQGLVQPAAVHMHQCISINMSHCCLSATAADNSKWSLKTSLVDLRTWQP